MGGAGSAVRPGGVCRQEKVSFHGRKPGPADPLTFDLGSDDCPYGLPAMLDGRPLGLATLLETCLRHPADRLDHYDGRHHRAKDSGPGGAGEGSGTHSVRAVDESLLIGRLERCG
jgi:hypothetical protein